MIFQKEKQVWIDAVTADLGACCPTIWAGLEPQFQRLTEETCPVVTLAGPYDSGKSSLLKRILVDAEVPVPKWLTVSSRRETFETSEAVACGAVFRDTPGTGGGNAEHERVAVSSVAATDVLMIIVPPQLFTAGTDSILSELKRIASVAPVFPSGSIYFVVARMDEAGSDPDDNPEDYRERVTRKLEEVRQLLIANQFDPSLVRTFAVAADPYQAVSGRLDVDRSEYDLSRPWDGVADLIGALRGDLAHATGLRETAVIRFLISTILDALASVERRLAQDRGCRDSAEQRLAFLTPILKQLDALQERARQHLLDGVQADVAQLISGSVTSIEAVGAVAKRRLETRFESWLNESQVALEQLLEPLETDWVQRPEGKPDFGKLTPEAPGGLGPDKSILRAFHKVLADDKNPVVRELKRDLAGDILKILGESRSRRARQQKWSKVSSRVAQVLVPLMIEVGRAAYEESQGSKPCPSTGDRQKLQADLFAAARDIALEGFELWRVSLADVRKRVDAAVLEAKEETESKDVEEWERRREALTGHLQTARLCLAGA